MGKKRDRIVTYLTALRVELERVIAHTDDGPPCTEVDARLMLSLLDTADFARYAVDDIRTSGLYARGIDELGASLTRLDDWGRLEDGR
jgi:hypothetical protein